MKPQKLFNTKIDSYFSMLRSFVALLLLRCLDIYLLKGTLGRKRDNFQAQKT